MNKQILEVRKFLKRHNLHLRSHNRTGGGHIRLIIVNSTGQELRHIMACTTSDDRSKLNMQKDILRFFKEKENGN